MSRVISSVSLLTVLLILSSLSVINSCPCSWLKQKPKITDKLIVDVCKNSIDQDFCKKKLSPLKGKTIAPSFTKSLGEETMEEALTHAKNTLAELQKLKDGGGWRVRFSIRKVYREYIAIVNQLASAKDAMSKGEGMKVRGYVFEVKNRAHICVKEPSKENSRYLIRLCDIILAICREDPTVK